MEPALFISDLRFFVFVFVCQQFYYDVYVYIFLFCVYRSNWICGNAYYCFEKFAGILF